VDQFLDLLLFEFSAAYFELHFKEPKRHFIALFRPTVKIRRFLGNIFMTVPRRKLALETNNIKYNEKDIVEIEETLWKLSEQYTSSTLCIHTCAT